MLTHVQQYIDLTSLAQARQSLLQADTAWRRFADASREVIDSLRLAGLSHEEAGQEFDALLKTHEDSRQAALKHLQRLEQVVRGR